MYLYAQKWEFLKVYLKLLNLRLLDFQDCNHCGCFFSWSPAIKTAAEGGKGVRMRVVNCLFVSSYSQGVEYWIKSDPCLPSKLLEYIKKYNIIIQY